jgi:phosphatidylserine decarboxylase
VNPVALRRVERLFCQNERAVIPLQTAEFGQAIILVPVAAVLVASIHLHPSFRTLLATCGCGARLLIQTSYTCKMDEEFEACDC